jgi:hypothetical protein
MNALLVLLISLPGVAVTAALVPALAARWFLAPRDRKRTEWLLVCVALAEPAGAAAQLTANRLSDLRPLKLDLYVYQFDRLFGEPSFALGQLVQAHFWLKILVSVAYGLLPTMIFAAFAASLLLIGERQAIAAARAFLLNLFLAVPLYLLFPVCGPAFAFPAFPALPRLGGALPMAIAAAPNGVPSVHTSSAILVLVFLWRWPWGRAAGAVYLGLIVLSTLGSGQHYFFDLLCALPYSAAVLWISARLGARGYQLSALSSQSSKAGEQLLAGGC